MGLLDMFKKCCAQCTRPLPKRFLEKGKLRFCCKKCEDMYAKKSGKKKTCEFC